MKRKSMSTIAPTLMKKKREYRKKEDLPQDFIMEEIVTRVPVWSLFRLGAVSKDWYKSIYIDKRLTDAHFLQSKKNPKFIFSLLNNATGTSFRSRLFEFPTENRFCDLQVFWRLAGSFFLESRGEMVGYCNGFPCMANVNRFGTSYTILQPNRGDFFHIVHPSILGEPIFHSSTICHGFGFDSLATEYKLVSVFRTFHKQLNILVFTLGTKSWRDITATTADVAHDGQPISWIRASTSSDRSAIFCTGSDCLVWKMIATIGTGEGANEMEMLLSFNLHDEKFQFIPLPSKSATDEQQKHLLVAYPRLLEFKGLPCIAYLEKKKCNGISDSYHQRQHDHHSSSCCCCCKVHLYLLRGEVKQAWVKEESFDVRVNSSWKSPSMPPDPCCFCVGNTSTPPTRIFSFSDQIFLYWFDGYYLQVYNLRSKKVKVVRPEHPVPCAFFEAKMKESAHISDDGDDNIYCSNMDYQLHCQGENFLSLKSFIPDGVAGVDDAAYKELISPKKEPPYTACVFVEGGSGVYFPFS